MDDEQKKSVHHHFDLSHVQTVHTLHVTISEKTLAVVCDSQNVEVSCLIKAELRKTGDSRALCNI